MALQPPPDDRIIQLVDYLWVYYIYIKNTTRTILNFSRRYGKNLLTTNNIAKDFMKNLTAHPIIVQYFMTGY